MLIPTNLSEEIEHHTRNAWDNYGIVLNPEDFTIYNGWVLIDGIDAGEWIATVGREDDR